MVTVKIIQSGDNYVYLCIRPPKEAFIIDPSESSKTLSIISEMKLKLTHIFITHHHFDHTAGLKELKSKTGCKALSPDSQRIPGTDSVVKDSDIIKLGDVELKVLATPGHTLTGVCYYIPQQKIVFTGDTLFVASCGRLMECDAATMYKSLQKLAAFPDETLVYCGHDYTEDNLEFALSIEPDNTTIKKRLLEIKNFITAGKPTVPSTILLEKQTNPFLRTDNMQIRSALKMTNSAPSEFFAELRRRKDKWG